MDDLGLDYNQRWQQINVKLQSGADMNEILREIHDLADDGFKHAQELMGDFYYQGNEYVKSDKRKAYQYYQKAARQGENMEQAQYRAYCLANELEIDVPITESSETFQFLKMSADQKFLPAVMTIASLYIVGKSGLTSVKINIMQGLHYVNLLSESDLKTGDDDGTIKNGLDMLRTYVKQQYPDTYREYYKNGCASINGNETTSNMTSNISNNFAKDRSSGLSKIMSIASVLLSILALYAGSEIRSLKAMIYIAMVGIGLGIEGVRHGRKVFSIVGIILNAILLWDGLYEIF